MTKKIFLLSLAVAVCSAVPLIAFADSAQLSISPASSAGSTITGSVKIDPVGNKVCVVKGTLNFANLTCQSISIASGITTQTAPTCSNPTFTLGIPSCTTAAQTLFTVSAKGVAAGQATLTFTGANVIGVGSDVPFTLAGGSYAIGSVSNTSSSSSSPSSSSPKNSSSSSSASKIESNTSTETTTPEVTTAPEITSLETTNQPAAVSNTPLSNSFSEWVKANMIWIIIGILLAIAAYSLYSYFNKKASSQQGN